MHAQCSECGNQFVQGDDRIDNPITVGTCPSCGLVAYFSTPDFDVGLPDEEAFLFEPFLDATREARREWEGV